MAVRPKILAVCFFSSRGSVADNFATLCRALARRADVSVLTSVGLRERDIEGVAETCYVNFSKFELSRWVSPRQWARLVRFARKKPFDLVFLYSEHPLHAIVVRVARARQSLFWCLDPVPHSGSVSTIARVYESAKSSLLKHADRIVVACDGLRRDMVERYAIPPRRVINSFHGVLDNLVFPEFGASIPGGSPAPNPPRNIDILFFGRLEAYKGVDVLVDAVNLLHHRGHSPSVVIAGPGSFRIPPASNVTVENRYVPDRELADMVARARIVVMPYRDATGSQVPQTAAVYGTPVVASATGCLSEYVVEGETGLLVPPANAKALADALERLLTDRDLWERCSAGARARATTVFDNDTLVADLLERTLRG